MKSEDETMLALAALTYRGFGYSNETRVRRELEPWLENLPKGLGQWRLAWGPAC